MTSLLRVHDLGGSGRHVLAAHATGFNGLVWRPLAEALTVAHVVAPDFRAHGGSPVPPDADLSWDRFADDVLATLEALDWTGAAEKDARPPVGIGHSMGGAALLLAELRRPGTFAGLWLYEPIVFPPKARSYIGSVDHPLAAGARRRRPGFASLAAAVETYGSKPPMQAFDRSALEAYVEGGFVDAPDGTVRLACQPEDEARIYTTAATCTAFRTARTGRLPRIGHPGTDRRARSRHDRRTGRRALPAGRPRGTRRAEPLRSDGGPERTRRRDRRLPQRNLEGRAALGHLTLQISDGYRYWALTSATASHADFASRTATTTCFRASFAASAACLNCFRLVVPCTANPNDHSPVSMRPRRPPDLVGDRRSGRRRSPGHPRVLHQRPVHHPPERADRSSGDLRFGLEWVDACACSKLLGRNACDPVHHVPLRGRSDGVVSTSVRNRCNTSTTDTESGSSAPA